MLGVFAPAPNSLANLPLIGGVPITLLPVTIIVTTTNITTTTTTTTIRHQHRCLSPSPQSPPPSMWSPTSSWTLSLVAWVLSSCLSSTRFRRQMT